MSEEVSSPSLEAVENDVRAAYDRLPEIKKSRRLLFWLKLSLPLAVLVIVLVGIWALFDTAKTNVVDRKEELWTHFQERAKNIGPRIQRQVDESAERVLPRLREQLEVAQRKAQQNLPDVLAKRTEGLGTRMEERMNRQLEESLGKVNAAQRVKLQSTYPDLLKCGPSDTPKQCQAKEEDLDRLMEEIQRSYQDWAIQEMRTTFDGHLKAMDDIRQTMAQIGGPSAGPGGVKTASTTDAPGDMLALWLELVAETVAGDSDLFEQEGVTDTAPEPDEGQ